MLVKNINTFKGHIFFSPSIHSPEQSEQLGNYLMEKFMQLLDTMFDFQKNKQFDGPKSSYNVLMTENHLHVIPRSEEEFVLSNDSKVSIGGICYAGIIIVEQEDDLDEMMKAGMTNVLRSGGRKNDQ